MSKLLKSKKRKVAPKETAAEEKKFVLVGTYAARQLEKWPGYYNYPLYGKDKIDVEAVKKVNELWLFSGAKEGRYFAAECLGEKTREELKEFGYKPSGKGHGSGKYLLFKVEKLYAPSRDFAESVTIRTKDFAGQGATQKQLKQYLESPDRKDPLLAKMLPKIVTELPRERLRVCEAAVQLDFLSNDIGCNAGFYMLGNTEVLSTGADDKVLQYLNGYDVTPLFVCGESLSILRGMPDNCIDCCMTSPPYWNKRQYLDGGIGLESDYRAFIDNLVAICAEVKRVLKSTGSFWLNIGDSYLEKNLLNIPSRVAIRLQDEQGWILRNTIIWNKVKGCPDNSLDKLRNIYEPIFHFVKKEHGYYYDVDAVRHKPHQTKVVNGAVVSATGVTGIRYKRKIEMSTVLTENQKQNAMAALDDILSKVQRSEISDFRMIIKGEQRTTHSDAESVSGRARELHEKGFYFLKYNPKGCKPSDLWEIIPEDTQGRETHFAPYPEDLCKMPIQLTCPRDGVVLDPFSGTGTTAVVAMSLGRKSIGIDISRRYIEDAKKRIGGRFAQGLLAL